MGGPGSGGARSGGNKSSALRAKEAAKQDKSQGKLSSFFAVPSPATEPVENSNNALVTDQSQSKHRAPQGVSENDLEQKRREAVKILHKVMNEGGLEQIGDDDVDNEDNDSGHSNALEDDDEEHEFEKASSSAYIPKPGSPLAEYLKQVKDQILIDGNGLRDQVLQEGLHWIPPPADPVVSSSPHSPDAWYLSDVWCFFWDPFLQHKMHMKSCFCHGCSKVGSLESKGYYWRPFFYFDKIVWVLHRRLRCLKNSTHCGCAKTFAACDPEFMSLNMPKRIAATFPFLVPQRGPGMHELMLFMFIELVVNRVQFGTFTNIFNSIYKLKYDQCRVSYYRTFKDKHQRASASGLMLPVPLPFGRFGNMGEYNGLRLTPGLVKRLFLRFMETHHEYFQASFQLCYDDGNSADHTHKYANVIKASGRKGHIFTASYTIASLTGFINVSRLCFTKSMFELSKVMSDYKDSRKNANAPPTQTI